MRKKAYAPGSALALTLSLLFLVAGACASRSDTPAPPRVVEVTRVVRETVVVTRVVRPVIPAPSVTPVPNTLTLCTGQEPLTLDPLQDATTGGALIRAALGEITVAPSPEGALMTETFVQVPTLDNGGAQLLGEEGPDGRIQVTYQLRAGLTWEDGTPLTARDFQFAWEVALRGGGGGESQAVAEEVERFEVVDDRTFVITLRQGLMTPLYAAYVFGPYPAHLLQDVPPEQVPASDIGRRWPSFGPYRLVSWEPGRRVVLRANPHYWRGEEQLPRVPEIVVRFLSTPEEALVGLLSTGCDVLAPDLLGVGSLPVLAVAAEQGLVRLQTVPGPAWEHLDLNTWPVDGRPPVFADPRVRRAVALALDRTTLAQRLTYGRAAPLASWLPPDHWAYQPVPLLEPGARDLDQARALLTEAGWRDLDGDGVREAQGVQGTYWDGTPWTIPDGTPLAVTLVTTGENSLRAAIARSIQGDLAGVGMRVDVVTLPPEQLFAGAGRLRQRTFDMALFAWVPGPDPGGRYLWVGNDICRRANGSLYAAAAGDTCEPGDELLYPSQIPTEENGWSGGNLVGWANPDASLAIYEANNRLTAAGRTPFYVAHQQYFGQDVPVIPLFLRPQPLAWRAGLRGVRPGPSTPLTWNVEEWEWHD